MEQPKRIGDARVVAWAFIDSDTIPTGKTIHRTPSEVLGPFSRLCICQYENDVGFSLFYCDDESQILADTWHQSFEEAKAQAEFEYQGITARWQSVYGDEM